MDGKKLFEAACMGDVEFLIKSLQENPLILTEFALTSLAESLLHVATKGGHLNFVREIVKHNPKLAEQSNKDGFRPIHIASIMGNTEIVGEFIKLDSNLCRVKDRDGRTALHYGGVNGRVEVIDEVLSACPDSIQDVTVLGESALHLAVKANQVDAFGALLNWIQRLNKQQMVNSTDCDGNTALHLAASRKQLKIIKLLLSEGDDNFGEIMEANAKNCKGLTAMDIFDIVVENSDDVRLREILRCAGGGPGSQQHHITAPKQLDLKKNWIEYFKFAADRDSPSDTRNALLVVAALIATVTFQAGLDPPTAFTSKAADQSNNVSPPPSSPSAPGAVVGLAMAAILGSSAPRYLFMFANTLGLAASISIIIYLTGGFPFQRELLLSVYSIMFAYGFSVSSIKETEQGSTIILGIASLLPFALRWLPRWAKFAYKWCTRRANHNLPVTSTPPPEHSDGNVIHN